MARAKSTGNGRLDEAMSSLVQAQAILVQALATLAQNQATFLTRMAETDARMAEMERIHTARMAEMERINTGRMAEIDTRFARIEAILIEHSRILRGLPDAIRDKIGFKVPEPPTG